MEQIELRSFSIESRNTWMAECTDDILADFSHEVNFSLHGLHLMFSCFKENFLFVNFFNWVWVHSVYSDSNLHQV